ncbi:MAG: TetR/AcrR family transcriptional regulator [Myxococcota bacterium]
MVEKVRPLLLAPADEKPSLRQLATAADVSLNTLRHYFGSREELVTEAFQAAEEEGWDAFELVGEAAEKSPREGLLHLLLGLVSAWHPDDLGGDHAGGLQESLGSEQLGPAFVRHVLEPALVQIEGLLMRWDAEGRLRVPDARAAALMIYGPLSLALIHQRQLHGHAVRPLNVDRFVTTLVDGFLVGHAVDA